MSVADYNQTTEDHGSLLILVKQVGCHLQQRGFMRTYERIAHVKQVHIHGQNRTIHLRYKKTYPQRCNEWGDFQAHRKVLGLVCIGKCENENEVNDLLKLYDDLQEAYGDTLYDSRLLLFGLNRDGSVLEERLRRESQGSEGGRTDMESKAGALTSEDKQNSNNIEGELETNSDEKSSSGKPAFQDPLNVNAVNNPRSPVAFPHLDCDLSPLGSSSSGKPSPLSSPLHHHSPLTSPTHRPPHSQQEGPASKDTALPHILCYPSETTCHDLEEKLQDFVASLFWVLESKRLDRSHEKQEKPPLLCTPFERKDLVGVDTDSRTYKRRCQGRLRKHLGDLCLLAGLPGESVLHYQTAMDILRNSVDWMWLGGVYEGLCAATVLLSRPHVDHSTLQRNYSFSTKRGSSAIKEASSIRPSTLTANSSVPNGLDLEDSRVHTVFPVDEIIDKFREAILQYAKFKQAGTIEMEASLKACRVVLDHQRFLAAANFLQNVVYINVQVHEEEKIQRFNTLAGLYAQLGMQRKAAFFRRISAMQCVAPTNPKPAWQQCYQLLSQALSGFMISLDPKQMLADENQGWPLIKVRVMHELIFSSRRMGTPAIAVRHLSFLLHTMSEHLSAERKQELAGTLELYTGRCEGTPQALALDNGTILPPIPFWKFPLVKSFKPQDMAPHLRPFNHSTNHTAKIELPPPLFIYSPMQKRDEVKPIDTNMLVWVEGDTYEVILQLHNILPFELHISNLGLLTEGCKLEMYPVSLSLPAESGPFQLKVTGTPRQPGTLNILGYTTCVLGVRSHCRLRDLPHLPFDQYTVTVVPRLPQLQLTTSLPKAASFSSVDNSDCVVTSAAVTIYTGQSCECEVRFFNAGTEPIDDMHLNLDAKLEPSLLQQLFEWNRDNLKSQLPLPPGGHACLTMYIHGLNSLNSDQGVNVHMQGDDPNTDYSAVVIDTLLKVEYSGGQGHRSGYWRQCAVSLSIELHTAITFTHSQVFPASSCDMCRVVMDLVNCTSHTLSMSCSNVGTSQTFYIDSHQCYRCVLEVPRCDSCCNLAALAQLPSDTPHDSSRQSLLHTLQEEVAQHLSNFVDVRWSMEEEEGVHVGGKVCLNWGEWTPLQLGHLLLNRLHIDVSCEGSDELAVECESGSMLHLQSTVVNRSETKVSNLCLNMVCAENAGTLNFSHNQLELVTHTSPVLSPVTHEGMVIIGSPFHSVNEILPGASHTFSHQVFFLYPGSYYVTSNCHGYLFASDNNGVDEIELDIAAVCDPSVPDSSCVENSRSMELTKSCVDQQDNQIVICQNSQSLVITVKQHIL